MTNALVFAVLMYGLMGLVSAPSFSADHYLIVGLAMLYFFKRGRIPPSHTVACATALVYYMYKKPDLDQEFQTPAERALFMTAVARMGRFL